MKYARVIVQRGRTFAREAGELGRPKRANALLTSLAATSTTAARVATALATKATTTTTTVATTAIATARSTIAPAIAAARTAIIAKRCSTRNSRARAGDREAAVAAHHRPRTTRRRGRRRPHSHTPEMRRDILTTLVSHFAYS